MKRVDLAGVAIEQTSGSPIVLLREQEAPHRVLPIFIGGPEAASIAVAVSGQAPPRPLTHDLMAALLETLNARVDAAEVTAMRDGGFVAQLTVSATGGEHHLDTRPSDAIAMAVRAGAPLLVSEAVLDEAGSVPQFELDDDEIDDAVLVEADSIRPVALDDDEIDDAVDEFRSFLDRVDPAQFLAGADTDADTADPGHDPEVDDTVPPEDHNGHGDTDHDRR